MPGFKRLNKEDVIMSCIINRAVLVPLVFFTFLLLFHIWLLYKEQLRSATINYGFHTIVIYQNYSRAGSKSFKRLLKNFST